MLESKYHSSIPMSHRLARVPLGLYRHYRGGLYEVMHNGHMEKTLEPVVVYKQHGKPDGMIFVRPLDEFEEDVVADDAAIRPRFEKVAKR